jgi:ubiquinone/menaquinone biosynthesis C-methylase UbiE
MSSVLKATAARYEQAARHYRQYWAPAMVSLSRPLVNAMPAEPDDRLLDLGCGVGAVSERVAKRARITIGIDASPGMLKRANRLAVERVAGDLTRLPFAGEAFDGMFSTFVLQHVSRTGEAFREAARALRSGGFVATATWGIDEAETGGPYVVADGLFARHHAPPEPPLKTWHNRVDTPEKMQRHARGAGLVVERAWSARVSHRWTVRTFAGWATTMGRYGRRLAATPDVVRARILEDLYNDLGALSAEDMRWTPEIVYLIAMKP